ncbi:MAG: hypothetical protein ACLVB5_01045 [Christensenellales bacterium]
MQNLHAQHVFATGKNTPESDPRLSGGGGHEFGGESAGPLPFANGWAAKAENVARFLAEMRRLKAAYAGPRAVYAGVEWDVLSDEKWLEPARHTFCPSAAIRRPIHRGRQPGDDAPLFGGGFDGDSDAAAECYFAQLRRVADAPRVQVVGHFDLLTKFDKKERFFDETSPRYRAAARTRWTRLFRRARFLRSTPGPSALQLGGRA